MRKGRRYLLSYNKRSKIFKIFLLCFSLIALGLLCFTGFKIFVHYKSSTSPRMLSKKWQEGDFEGVYLLSDDILEKNPFDKEALQYYGYSCVKLAVETGKVDYDSIEYLDSAINSLRILVLLSGNKVNPQVYYVLGLSYYFKNLFSSYHYYADLSAKYFELAQTGNYKSDDIPEFLGLCYASLGENEKSIKSFTLALNTRPSDNLLFNIAKNYFDLGQDAVAIQYLQQILDTSQDDIFILKSTYLRGRIYLNEDKIDEARGDFDFILKKDENFADAHYGLGVIYEKEGNKAKARSELRKCLKLQPNHIEALKKITEIK